MSLIRTARIALATRAHRRAATRARNYISQPARGGDEWNVLVQLAFDRAECEAANKLARLVSPGSIARAF